MVERLSENDGKIILDKLMQHVSLPELLQACTVDGEGQKIKTNKPTDGVFEFVWRMARFHNGADVTMPTTCYWDLEDGIKKLTGIKVSTAIIDASLEPILKFLDQQASALVEATGGNKYAGAFRWGRVLGSIR